MPARWAGWGRGAFAQLGAPNTFTSDQTINGNLNFTGLLNSSLALQGNLTDSEGEQGANVIGGFGGNSSYPGNSIAPGVIGATIAGGGGAWDPSSAPPPPLRRATQPALRANGRFVGRARRSEQQPEAKPEPRSVPSGVVSGSNVVSSGSDWSTIGGGEQNTAGAWGSTVSGGALNSATNTYATVSGGLLNTASGYESTVGGGTSNSALQEGDTVGGGELNVANSNYNEEGFGSCEDNQFGYVCDSTVAGGYSNLAGSFSSTVGGGQDNVATGYGAVVAGGEYNSATGSTSVVPGGYDDTAIGTNSFAAGESATANYDGSFVWNAYSLETPPLSDSGPGQFLAEAYGGFFFYTAHDFSTGATLPSGSGSWSSISDRNVKANFAAIDGEALLAKLAALPISTWNYKAQDVSIRHMGPMAQDFHAAFGLGEDDKHIPNIDSEGVSLAAIQALYKLNQEKDAKIAELAQQLSDKARKLESLEVRMAKLEALATAKP